MKIRHQLKRPIRYAHHSLFFMKEWLQSPRNVGAIAPSSSSLGDAMARQIDLSREGVVIELGGGTGALTRALLKRGVAERNLYVFEQNPKFAKLLRKHFPAIHVIEADARDIEAILAKLNIKKINSIISGIPLRSVPKDILSELIAASFSVLPVGSSFIQFTYGVRPPVPMELIKNRLFNERAVAKIWRNLPPATVWRYTRR